MLHKLCHGLDGMGPIPVALAALPLRAAIRYTLGLESRQFSE
jgi:hypothetical protein